MKTFQEFAAEDLQGFGWSITAEDIPEWETLSPVMRGIVAWINSLDQKTKNIVRSSDVSDGLWEAGMLNDWPALYTLLNGNKFGTFADTFDDVVAALNRAHHQVDEQPSDPISDVNEVVNAGAGENTDDN